MPLVSPALARRSGGHRACPISEKCVAAANPLQPCAKLAASQAQKPRCRDRRSRQAPRPPSLGGGRFGGRACRLRQAKGHFERASPRSSFMPPAVRTTEAARAAFRGSFEVQVDPNGVLTDAERQRRAEYARRAHMTRLALASSRARSAGRQQIAAVGTTPTAAMEDLDDASTSPTPLAV